MKKTIILCFLLGVGTICFAQTRTKDGGISQEMLRKITAKPASKALQNAISSNNIDDLSRNKDNRGQIDNSFSVETPKQSIHDQKSSGRCWMFSGLNVLRSNFAKKHQDSLKVEFSQAYLFFYDQLEKSNFFLQSIIDTGKKPIDDKDVRFLFKNPVSDGGTFCGVTDLTAKYGVVPMSVQPETYSSESTSRIRQIIRSKLRQQGLELRKMVQQGKSAKALKDRKTEMLGEIYSMLSLTLGEPVKTFKYAFKNKKGKVVIPEKTYTPQEFYQLTVGEPLYGTFIMVMNDPRKPYHKVYEVQYDRHSYDGHNWKYLNLPMEDISNLAITSLKDGTKLYSSYDAGKQLDRKRGYADTENYDYSSLFDTDFSMTKAERIDTYDSGSTHAMTLTAVDLDENGKPLKWKVENSWGKASGVEGCVIMTNRWFNEYMFRLVVDNKYVPQQLLNEFNQTPIMVTYEDPLFGSVDE